MGLQEIHEYEALGGGSGRRLRCRLTSLSRSLQTILRINLDGTTILKDDADEVAQICYTLQSSFENSGGDNKESVNDMEDDGLVEDNKDFSQSGTTNLSSEFRIIFTTENGSQTIYSLSGYKLINETTKQETLLTADQRSNILDTLGLTITWEEEPK